MDDEYQILLTNDDGILSPGLWAAAEALSSLGFVHVVAPREQNSGTGRSMPISSDGIIRPQPLVVNNKEWTVYSIGGTPAQTVLYAILEITPRLPDLVVSGINYGENLGTGVTVSGTVGAALEGGALGIPALAISLETDPNYYLSHSDEVDFSTAAYFCAYFGHLLLEKRLPEDVNVLKVDIPANATPQTPWKTTFLSNERYYDFFAPQRMSWEESGAIRYEVSKKSKHLPGSDAYTLRVEHQISVTPLSLDLTSRVVLSDFDKVLRGT
jgi:5'-nucleotidase